MFQSPKFPIPSKEFRVWFDCLDWHVGMSLNQSASKVALLDLKFTSYAITQVINWEKS